MTSLALEDGALHWSERSDGAWHADTLGMSFQVIPNHHGKFVTWVKLDGQWQHLGKPHISLGEAFAAARRYADEHAKTHHASEAAEGELDWSIDDPHVRTSPQHVKGRKGQFCLRHVEGGPKPYVLTLDGHTVDTYESPVQAKKVANHLNALHEARETVPVIHEATAHPLSGQFTSVEVVYAGTMDAVFEGKANKKVGGVAFVERYSTEGRPARRVNVLVYDFPSEDEARAFEKYLHRSHAPKSAKISVYPTKASRGMSRHASGEAREDLAIDKRDVAAVRAGRKVGQIKTAQDVYELLHPVLVEQHQEVFVVWPLDIHGRPTTPKPYEVARGQLDSVRVDSADVLRPVIKDGVKGFILCHNHPSGAGKASPADVDLTKTINEAASKMDLVCLDHVVIGDGHYESVREAYGKKAGFR